MGWEPIAGTFERGERMISRRFVAEGHLVDSGILTRVLNTVVAEGGDFRIDEFRVGRTSLDPSRVELTLVCADQQSLESLTFGLINLGCYEREPPEALIRACPRNSCAPEDFYATTNLRTEVYVQGAWHEVEGQRMDCVIVSEHGRLACRKLRDLADADRVVCGTRSIRVFPFARRRESGDFGFMEGAVSSERSVGVAVRRTAELLSSHRGQGVAAVAGPVVVHTGGAPALASLIRAGYVHRLLAGNALAVHDIEAVLFGTSLGVDLASGRPAFEGHRNHMRAINRVLYHGSIAVAVAAGEIREGIMFEAVRRGIPFVLAGSLRDDGPLPETITDVLQAQRRYEELLAGAEVVLMLASMLHSVATGNMLPAWVTTICVDINPAVVTKLSDRGTSQAVGIVTDVGLFLRLLAQELEV